MRKIAAVCFAISLFLKIGEINKVYPQELFYFWHIVFFCFGILFTHALPIRIERIKD